MKKPLPKQLFVTGIGTGIGKTVVSAILTEALQADYWKPVQAGGLDNSDSMVVQSLLSNKDLVIHKETYKLETAASPHYAAHKDGIEIEFKRMAIPAAQRTLVIEGAGGLMVPLNKRQLVIDYIKYLEVPVVLVAKNYLGSINHTLLSIEILKNKRIEIAGIIFNGNNYFDNEEIVQHFSGIPVIGRIEETEMPGTAFVKQQAEKLRLSLREHFEW